MKALLSADVRIPSSFSQLSSPSRFHFHIKKIWGYIWRICLKIKNWISRSTTLTKARRRLKREIKSSFQESQTILNGLLTVLPQNIQGDTILFEPFETLFYLIEYVFLVMIAKSQIDSQMYSKMFKNLITLWVYTYLLFEAWNFIKLQERLQHPSFDLLILDGVWLRGCTSTCYVYSSRLWKIQHIRCDLFLISF